MELNRSTTHPGDEALELAGRLPDLLQAEQATYRSIKSKPPTYLPTAFDILECTNPRLTRRM